MTEHKLNTIEEALAHQEQQIQDLSDMVICQGDEIILLKKHIRKLNDKIGMIEDSAGSGAADGENLSVSEAAAMNKPPHY